ncbi:VOC family protein [Nonomuraea sp. LPB2021202275-12-8]|uniref:VOC family protein n=1 Tax=Nonomuraea sp. LPB2021202275-12-8 TaxID=3120159 RepID=UPI00300C9ADA
MNIASSAVSLTVADPPASSRFFTIHLGFREILAGEEFIALGRDDGAVDLVLVERDLERWQPGQGLADLIVVFTATGLAAEYERLRGEGAPITIPLRREPWVSC